jgi:hypothetical protein
MSLLRLLAAGKSLIGIKGKPTEYKLTQENLVPKFVNNPPSWSATAKPSPRKEEGQVAATTSGTGKQSHETEQFVQAKFAPKKEGAQGELPLLNVVRNDLSDADLEVAPLKKGIPARPKVAGVISRGEKGLEKAVAGATGH